ncbi:hypothetical protein AB0C65_00480 [Nocardia sp. NPDC048505]|uniref:hypothetical protein n=1 Tax=Nocardia sp. NPDC048505 TaxID=3155756 RepID=UPI0033F54634
MYDAARTHGELDRSVAAVFANLFEVSHGPLGPGLGCTPWLLFGPAAAPRPGRRWNWLRADGGSRWAFAAIAEAVRTHG